MQKTEKSRRMKRIQRAALVLLFAGGIVNYLDRSALSIANSAISAELDLTPTQMGVLLSAFSWSYAFAQLPIGALLDKFGVRKTMSLGLIVWSFAQMACGLVSSYAHLIWLRIVLGAGESVSFPGGAKVVSEWFSVKDRGFATSVFTSAAMIAPTLAPIVLTGILLAFGWRAIFVSTGILGVVLGVAFWLLYRDRHDVDLTESERQQLDEAAPQQVVDKPTAREWFSLLKLSITWGLIFGFIGVIYMLWLYLTWLPGYFEKERGFSLARTGWVVAVPFLFGAIGLLMVGTISDFLVRKGMDAVRSRKIPICVGLLASALFTIPAAYTPNHILAVAYLSAAMFFLNIANGGSWSLVSVVIPSRLTASLGSIMNFGGYLGGSIAPIATGAIVERTGSFSGAFVLAAGVAICGSLLFMLCVRDTAKHIRSAPV